MVLECDDLVVRDDPLRSFSVHGPNFINDKRKTNFIVVVLNRNQISTNIKKRQRHLIYIYNFLKEKE